jgi:protein gp37
MFGLGVTVKSSLAKYHIDYLRKLSASIKFLSCEPLLESLDNLNLDNIDWVVIVGGESGFKARPMKEEWALQIQAQTERQGTAFFF